MRSTTSTAEVELRSGALRILQPSESAELPDDGPVEWAPIAPYWSVLWRSGVTLAREVDAANVEGLRILELGCGLGLPSLAAARGGARVLATDADVEAVELLRHNARQNEIALEAEVADWTAADELGRRGPFDIVLAADVLYEREAAEPLLDLLPRLAREVWLADPGRAPAETFLEAAQDDWRVRSERRGVVVLHTLQRA